MALEDLKKDSSFKKQYKLLKAFGQGAFGTVHLVQNRQEKKQYALKVIPTRDRLELHDARQEILLFKDLEHPHIVHYKTDFEIQSGVAVVMEYCENGDLQKRIASRSPDLAFFSESQVVDWATHICKALQYLHSKNILHRDLKPANMFLTKKDVIKLGDFGVARRLADVVDLAVTVCGTPLYLSPEIVQNKAYNHKSDVWSAGCCIYEIMALNPAIDPVPVRISQQWNVRPMPLNVYSDDLCDVVASMLNIDCNERPSIDDNLQKLIYIQTAHSAPMAVRRPQTAQTDLPHEGRCRSAQFPPIPAPRPSRAIVSTIDQDLSTEVHDDPTAQDNSTSAVADNSKLQSIRRSSLDGFLSRAIQTLDFRGRYSASLDSGAPEVAQEDHSVAVAGGGGKRSSSSSGEGADQTSRTTWYSTSEVDDEIFDGDGFWTISDSSIAENLAALGVRFNNQGQLVELSTGGRYQFKYWDDETANQLRYEEIGDQIIHYVYNLLETKLHMKRCWLPTDAADEPRSFIFVTEDYATNDKKLLVLVHGPGVPRAGQWSRKVIMNDSLAAGTQIPWIQQAVKDGYAVMVLNPNLNKHADTGTPIRESEDGARHALYVWDKVIAAKVKAPKVAFAAHSAGANIVLQLASEREKAFSDRVFGIALTDSCLDFDANTRPSVINLFAKRARIWASSAKRLDTALTSGNGNAIPKYSAGETEHEWTAGSCVTSAFKFLNKRYKKN